MATYKHTFTFRTEQPLQESDVTYLMNDFEDWAREQPINYGSWVGGFDLEANEEVKS